MIDEDTEFLKDYRSLLEGILQKLGVEPGLVKFYEALFDCPLLAKFQNANQSTVLGLRL